MADFLAGLGRSLDVLLAYLGIHRVNALDAAFYVLGATIFLVFCAAVHSAIRIAFLRCSARK
ncbi:MAG: hypothetical protein ABSE42_13110 [Bryobacteraceae bacterium]|jgi:hypothetical protein